MPQNTRTIPVEEVPEGSCICYRHPHTGVYYPIARIEQRGQVYVLFLVDGGTVMVPEGTLLSTEPRDEAL